MVSIFVLTMCYLHTKFYMCFSDFRYDSPRVPAYLWSRGKLFFSFAEVFLSFLCYLYKKFVPIAKQIWVIPFIFVK